MLRPGGEGKRRLPEIPGLVPSLDSQPDACTFAPRCSRADTTCTEGRPGFRAVDPEAGADASHRAACWHPYERTVPETGTEPVGPLPADLEARPDQEAGK